jgi:hypothetical protein
MRTVGYGGATSAVYRRHLTCRQRATGGVATGAGCRNNASEAVGIVRWQVLRDYVVLMRRMDAQGTQQDGIWVVGAAALATVFCCNCFWFYKVCLGVVKHMGGKKRKAT